MSTKPSVDIDKLCIEEKEEMWPYFAHGFFVTLCVENVFRYVGNLDNIVPCI